MRIKTINIYQFDELNEDAKERAREWWRAAAGSDEWWDGVYMDADRAELKITGFDLDRQRITGSFNEDAMTTARAIIADHGDTCGTYKTAAAFLGARDKIIDEAPRDGDGEFEDERELDSQLDDVEKEFLHDILEDYRLMLQRELAYQMSDEAVDECICSNEYEFTEDGKIA